MFHLILYQPEIPPNTGNVIRLCANTGVALHLVERVQSGRAQAAACRARLSRVRDRQNAPVTRCLPGGARPAASLCVEHPGHDALRHTGLCSGRCVPARPRNARPATGRTRRVTRRTVPASADAARQSEPEPVEYGRHHRLRGLAATRVRRRRLSIAATRGSGRAATPGFRRCCGC